MRTIISITKSVSLIFSLLMFSLVAIGQEDYEGCKDHPLFNRMPNYYISECINTNYGTADFDLDAYGSTESLEGTKTVTTYIIKDDHSNSPYSFLQVVKNYENALAKYQVKRVYAGTQDATLKCKIGNKTVWLGFQAASEIAETYTLTILEIEEMQQDITASGLLDELNNKGHVALYINFETGKSDIKPESQNVIDQVARMLLQNSTLKIGIEGHTDNVGTPASNQTLSLNRANAVMNALIAQGVDKTRMTARGFGQSKPIADNATGDGKALNRRVEIIKL